MFIATLIFLIVVEAWKFAKRIYYRRLARLEQGGDGAEEHEGIFKSYLSMTPANTLQV